MSATAHPNMKTFTYLPLAAVLKGVKVVLVSHITYYTKYTNPNIVYSLKLQINDMKSNKCTIHKYFKHII